MNVLVWNYRGYGRTQGASHLSPQQIMYDSEQVLHFLRYRIGVRGKIGVYGRSLGCTASCYLASQPCVDMVIADRGFCDLWTLAEKKFHGKIARSVFKWATGGWQGCNSYNYLKAKKTGTCYKVLLCDQNDEIVNYQSSLMVGVAKELCVNRAK